MHQSAQTMHAWPHHRAVSEAVLFRAFLPTRLIGCQCENNNCPYIGCKMLVWTTVNVAPSNKPVTEAVSADELCSAPSGE